MKELWFPSVVRHPGPAWKTTGIRTRTEGAVYHSAVGSLAGTLAVLGGPKKSSWHLTNAKDGRMFQHYPLDVLTWHARGGNSWSIGVENEGGPTGNESEPLTEAQVQNLVDLSAWLVEQDWLPGLTRTGDKTLWEHNEVGQQAAIPYVTACPSGRIDPAWERIARLEELDMATAEQLQRQINVLIASAGIQQEELDLHGGQIRFLSKIAVAHQKAIEEQGGAPAAAIDPAVLARLEASDKTLGIKVEANRTRIADAAKAMAGEG